MFAQGASHNSSDLTNAKHTPSDSSLRCVLSQHLAEHINHFLAEPFAVERRIKTKRVLIKPDAQH